MDDTNGNSNTLATVSLVCGVMSIVCLVLNCCGIPLVGLLAPPLAIVAIVAGAVAMSQGESGGPAMIGAGTGCATLLLYILTFVLVLMGVGGVFLLALLGAAAGN